MRRVCAVSLAAGAAAVLVLGMLLGVAGCQDLRDGAATTVAAATSTTSAPVETSTTEVSTTTSVFAPGAGLTEETNPCLLVDAYTRDGVDYLVVDYLQVKWVAVETYYEPRITNSNSKLRTFVVPLGADLSYGDFEALKSADLADLNSETSFGYWSITVSNGFVLRLEMGDLPAELNTGAG